METGKPQTNGLDDKEIDDYTFGLIAKRWHRLYVSRKEGGRGLVMVEVCVNASTQILKEYIKKIKERLITVASNSNGNTRTNKKIPPPTN